MNTPKNYHAQALAQLGRGIKKTMTAAAIAQRKAAARGTSALTPCDRLEAFRQALAELVLFHDVELSCEPMTPISVVCADAPMAGHFDFPSNATSYEIAKAEIVTRLTV